MWLCMHCDFSTFSCYFTETKSRSYFSPLLMTRPNSLSDNVFINALKDASCCPHVLWEHSNCAVAERILATLYHNSSRTWGRVDSFKSSTFTHCNKISLFTLMSPSEEKISIEMTDKKRQKKLRKTLPLCSGQRLNISSWFQTGCFNRRVHKSVPVLTAFLAVHLGILRGLKTTLLFSKFSILKHTLSN